jgi:hypothetical protein
VQQKTKLIARVRVICAAIEGIPDSISAQGLAVSRPAERNAHYDTLWSELSRSFCDVRYWHLADKRDRDRQSRRLAETARFGRRNRFGCFVENDPFDGVPNIAAVKHICDIW